MSAESQLIKAAGTGDLETCKTLIAEGHDVNVTGAANRTALQRAAGGNFSTLVEALIELKANVNQQDKAGRTAMHWAVLGGHHVCVNILLKNGADYNLKNNSKQTPLILAVESEKLEAVSAIIQWSMDHPEQPLDYDSKDSENKSAMDYAKEKKSAEMAFMLKEKRTIKPGENVSGGCVMM